MMSSATGADGFRWLQRARRASRLVDGSGLNAPGMM